MATTYRDHAALWKTVLDGVTGLDMGLQLGDAAAGANTEQGARYSIDLQDVNTGLYRDRSHERIECTVTVTIMHSFNPLDQWTSQLAALDLEELVVERALDQSNLPACAVYHVSTKRALTPTREQLKSTIVFTSQFNHPLE